MYYKKLSVLIAIHLTLMLALTVAMTASVRHNDIGTLITFLFALNFVGGGFIAMIYHASVTREDVCKKDERARWSTS
ncbi:MAG: hypothetical protein EOP06_00050 [Proteobacteria bacterium]|nr:MAG: hypothetical protein EOP06_00050 [Pseudomonadota bacterium]